MLTTDSREHVKGVSCQSWQVYPHLKNMYTPAGDIQMKRLAGGTQIWTGDLLICSQMLYHWARPPLRLTLSLIHHILLFFTPGEHCATDFSFSVPGNMQHRQESVNLSVAVGFERRTNMTEAKKKAPLMALGKRSIDFNSGITHCGHKVLV